MEILIVTAVRDKYGDQGVEIVGVFDSMEKATKAKTMVSAWMEENEYEDYEVFINSSYGLNDIRFYDIDETIETMKAKAEKADLLLSLLADNIPDDPNEFNSETGIGEPQHWMTLPYDRSLEIVYEETGDDNRYYTWRVHCNEEEFENDEFHDTIGVMDTSTSDDLHFDTRLARLEHAIKVASEKPRA